MAGLLQLLRHARGQALLASARAEMRSTAGPAQALVLGLRRWPFTPGFASSAEPPDDRKPPAALAHSDSEEDAEGALSGLLIQTASACSICACYFLR